MIIDEGHNVSSVAEEGYSAVLGLNTIYSVIVEISSLKEKMLKQSHNSIEDK